VSRVERLTATFAASVSRPAAIGFGIASALLFAFSNVALRFAHSAGAFDIALIRSAVFALALAPMTLYQPRARLGLRTPHTAVAIGLFTATTILTGITWFLGLRELPLATATSLFSLKALFTVLGAALFMGEHLTRRRLGAVCIGFIGAVVLLDPAQPSWLGGALVLGAAASSALSGIFYAQLVRLQSPGRVLLVSSLLQLLALAPFAIAESASLPPFTLGMATGSAILSIGVMYTLAWAYRGAEVGLIASLEYLRLPLAAGLAFVFFAERPTGSFYVGSTIIILGVTVADSVRRPR
jgi:drug/metabolite transporter (DMT)-like permease